MVVRIKIFMDLDKTKLKIYINYFVEDTKILIRIPLKKDNKKGDDGLIIEKFDISNKIYLSPII